MKKFWVGAGIVVILELIVIGIIWWQGRDQDFGLLNPLGKRRGEIVMPTRAEVVGFLPTWMVGKTKYYGKELTQLVFLGIEVKENGTLLWDGQSKKINSDEYLKLRASVARNGGKNILGIKLFEDEKLDKIMKNEKAKTTLLREVKAIVEAGDFDGVNIDFEYMNNPTWITEEEFVDFAQRAKAEGWKRISVDVFANTIIKGEPEKLKVLQNTIDEIIVMAYDFHRPGSTVAGPVAPIETIDGVKNLTEITDKVVNGGLDPRKIIMAYPLYGYQWETVDGSFGAATMPNGYGVTVLYKEGIGYTGAKTDDLGQGPWFAWTEKEQRSRVKSVKVGRKIKKVTEYYEIDQWHQAYLENEESLKAKVDLAKRTNMGGIGFWALGYEGKESNLILDLRNRIYQ